MTKSEKTELKCIAGGLGVSALAGYAVGKAVGNAMYGCNVVEKTLLMCGSCVLSFAAGQAVTRGFYKFCDKWFDTDLESYCDL